MTAEACVLVVEDEDVIRRILVTVLQELGHKVLEAKDGEEATTIIAANHQIDVLITDKNLPGMNGLELMRLMRARQPDTQLMMVTGYASYESVLEALRLGACDYMEKPFLDLASIQQRVQDAVQRGRGKTAPQTAVQLAQRLVDQLRDDGGAALLTALPLAEQALAALKK